MENVQSGFRATGMFPVNMNVISADFFVPSAITERAQQPLAAPMPQEEEASREVMDTVEVTITGGPQPAGLQDAEVPSTSTGRSQDEEAIQSTSSGRVSFHNLIVVSRRERTTRKPHAKPPSYWLTSQDHFLYVERAKKVKEEVKVVQKNEMWMSTKTRHNALAAGRPMEIKMTQKQMRTGFSVQCVSSGTVPKNMDSLMMLHSFARTASQSCRVQKLVRVSQG